MIELQAGKPEKQAKRPVSVWVEDYAGGLELRASDGVTEALIGWIKPEGYLLRNVCDRPQLTALGFQCNHRGQLRCSTEAAV